MQPPVICVAACPWHCLVVNNSLQQDSKYKNITLLLFILMQFFYSCLFRFKILPVYLDNPGIRHPPRNFRHSFRLLLLAITIRQLDVFWLLTMCAETLTYLENLLLL
jgi:hypothetical protein